MLILAGITISNLTGSGLFEKAKLAEQKSKEAQELENSILGNYENKIDEIVNTRENTTNEKYGYDETTGFHYYISPIKFCVLWMNYTAPDTTSSRIFNFPFEFQTEPGCQITKSSLTTTSNNIVITKITQTYLSVDSNYGTQDKCSYSIMVYGMLK